MIGRRFNAKALYEALDRQRQDRNLSWRQVADETGVSVATLTRTRRGGRMELDGALSMVRWLNRTIESFTDDWPGTGSTP
jgi:transcriptional regulator with XRE-family HTH domain